MSSSKVEHWKSKKGIHWLPLQSHTRCLILCHYLFLMIHTASQFSANELLIYKTKERFISIDIPSYIERRYSTMGKRPLISPRSPKIDWNENVHSLTEFLRRPLNWKKSDNMPQAEIQVTAFNARKDRAIIRAFWCFEILWLWKVNPQPSLLLSDGASELDV